MIYKKIALSETAENVFLECYIPDVLDGFVRDALLVIPGGGYGMVCSDREGEPIALSFIPHGFACFVLHYSIGEKALFPRPLIEASLAIGHIKDHAEEYGINKDRVFATGFSAGGHLSASLACLWHMKEIYDATGMEFGYNKPTGVLPIYPVITAGEMAHKGSFYNILGTQTPTDEELDKFSLEKCVDERTCPMFLAHSADDQVVPVENSLYMAEALSKAKIPFELHIFKTSPHGFALGNKITECNQPLYTQESIAKWVELAALWIKSI